MRAFRTLIRPSSCNVTGPPHPRAAARRALSSCPTSRRSLTTPTTGPGARRFRPSRIFAGVRGSNHGGHVVKVRECKAPGPGEVFKLQDGDAPGPECGSLGDGGEDRGLDRPRIQDNHATADSATARVSARHSEVWCGWAAAGLAARVQEALISAMVGCIWCDRF